MTIEPLPIKQFSPTETLPFKITPVLIWELLLIITPCSVKEFELIMQFDPIFELEKLYHKVMDGEYYNWTKTVPTSNDPYKYK